MNCQRCKSERVLAAGCKCSDMYNHTLKGQEYDGYVPHDVGLGGGDYINISVCLDCGQLQGEWPLAKTEFESEIEQRENDLFKKGDYVEFEQHGHLWVGCVEEYDRDNLEVVVEAHGTWNEDLGKLGPIAVRPGPRNFQRNFKIDQDEVKKTTKEW